MAILDSVGTIPQLGVATLTGYIVSQRETGGGDLDSEDVEDEDGARVARLIFKRDTKLTLNLIAKAGTDYAADFPEHDMCTVIGLTDYFVDSARVTHTKGALKLVVEMTDIGIT